MRFPSANGIVRSMKWNLNKKENCQYEERKKVLYEAFDSSCNKANQMVT